MNVLENYAKCSQDLSPMEIAWCELKVRLDATLPAHFESRAEFISRLRNAVVWVNADRTDLFYELCTCQKKWARDVKNATPPGSRTVH